MILATPPVFEPLASIATLPPVTGDTSKAGVLAREYVQAVRGELRVRHDAGAGGLAVVAAYTQAIDALVSLLFANATLRYKTRNPFINQRCSVVGQGGYGRGELNPSSDIDLLFLYPWKANPFVETVAEVILYALWDAGLQVGHAMRNVRECARLAARDLKVKTALLDARYLCGDAALYHEFEVRSLDEVWNAHQAQFFKDKLAESVERHARAGDSVYLLQPQLKEGQGGLRDLHTALWMAKVKYKVRSLHELVALGVVSERDVAGLTNAVDFLWRVRNAMHFLTESHQDHLTFELQEQIAPTLGFSEGRRGVEAFMRSYYRHAASANRFSDAVIARCVQAAEPYRRPPPVRVIGQGMRIQGTQLSVTGREVFERDPAAIVRLFAEAQRHGVAVAPATAELVRQALPPLGDPAAARRAAEAFLEVLRGRSHVADTLFEMHKLGVLGALVPEFGQLECLIAHDPFHIYTVDHHSLMGLRVIERLRAGEIAAELPHLTEAMREVQRPELVFLGMLFHDVGKGTGKDHSGRGAVMARTIATRLGLDEDAAAACVFLVQHHLLMSHLGQRRDVHDDQLVIDFCRTVGSVDNLQMLYVLTYADMRSVGPGVWNNWRGMLVTELYLRAREFLEKGVFEAEDRAARAARVRERVVAGVPAAVRPATATFVESMPDSYMLATPEELIPQHAELRRRFAEREAAEEHPAVATLITPFPERGFSEFAVCMRDRPGLFAMLSGVLAAHGMNILGARINTSNDEVAFDAFRVSQDFDATLDRDRWERVERTLRGVARGELDVEELVARSGRPSLLRRRHRPLPTRVEIDNAVSKDFTVLDVYTGDRVGLLFTITNRLYHLWLEIHLAKIATVVDQALDVFYVTDNEGRKIEDPQRLEIIRSELIRALDPETSDHDVGARASA